MKKSTFLSIIIVLFLISGKAFAQPNKMTYQAVIRNNSGQLLSNMQIGVNWNIYDNVLNTNVATESFTANTNVNGLLTFDLGMIADLSTISWEHNDFDFQLNIDPNGGTNYTITMQEKLNSVPFAFKVKNVIANTAVGIGSNALQNNQDLYSIGIGADALQSNTVGLLNTGIGASVLKNNITGSYNVGIGANSLYYNTAESNTAIGTSSMQNNLTGVENTGIGRNSLFSNSSGERNIGVGFNALFNNISGFDNNGVGYNALYSNTIGTNNLAFGRDAMYTNTIGVDNTSIGNYSLAMNLDGNANVCIGKFALNQNTSGSSNTAVGLNAMALNTTGIDNTAIGRECFYNNTSGNYNTSIGSYSLSQNLTGFYNTAIGRNAGLHNQSGSNNTFIGMNAFYGNNLNGINNIIIGYNAGTAYNGNNRAEIGNQSITWIGGQVGWSQYSDGRIKNNVSENIPGLAFITLLRPVSYNFNVAAQEKFNNKPVSADSSKFEIEKIKQTGFIAQEVAEAANSIGYDFSGVTIPANENELYSIRYSEFVVPLVKAVQELEALVKKQQAEIELLKKNSH
jgi:hypothetical protein